MQDVVDAINAQTSTTSVQASIVQVSSGSYEMVLSGTADAADISYSSTSGSDSVAIMSPASAASRVIGPATRPI